MEIGRSGGWNCNSEVKNQPTYPLPSDMGTRVSGDKTEAKLINNHEKKRMEVPQPTKNGDEVGQTQLPHPY